MAKKTKQTPPPKPVETETPKKEEPGWLSANLYRPRFLISLAVLAVIGVFGPQIIRLLPDLSSQARYRVPTSDIVVLDRPEWVSQDFLTQVIERAGLPEEVSVLDEGLTERLYRAFKLHPWVADVNRISKSSSSRIEVELTFRRPAAMIESQNRIHPVDRNGVLLPAATISESADVRLPIVQNVRSIPHGPAGSEWGDSAVRGAARLADTLQDKWERFGLTTIFVIYKGGPDAGVDDVSYELSTRGRSRILWGRSPESTYPGELSADEKIARLEEYFTRYKGFDEPQGPYEIDIRHWQEITRHPISAADLPIFR